MPISLTQAEKRLQKTWGYPTLRPGQREAVQAVLRGHDAVVVLPTGGGKSLCYQLPAVLLPGCAVVVSPLIALMEDQVQALRARGVAAAALHSQRSPGDRYDIQDSLKAGELDLLYVSPERAVLSHFRALTQRHPVSLLAIDEAHCISQWGHDFRPEYLRLHELRYGLSCPTVAVTATATERVRTEIIEHLHLKNPQVILGSFSRPNLSMRVHPLSTDAERFEHLVELLRHHHFQTHRGERGRCIVYCATRKTVEKVASDLKKHGFDVCAYHAGLSDRLRQTAQARYDSGKARIMVATNAFGMGIDHPNVRLIVHFQTPGSVEAYYQEAGRAGRDGQPSECHLYYGHRDLITQARLAQGHQKQHPRWESALDAMRAYAEGRECRQTALHAYFSDDAAPPPCGHCDVCAAPHVVADSFTRYEEARAVPKQPVSELTEAQLDLIVDAVGSLLRPVGKVLLARALRGSRAKELKRRGLLQLPQHGALHDVNEASLVAAIDDLLAEGRLSPRGQKYPTVWLPHKPVRPTGDNRVRRRPKRPASELKRALENYRKRQARKLNWKPYMVFHRKVIDAIDHFQPNTLWGLEEINGLGPAKVERFGSDLLELIRRHGN